MNRAPANKVAADATPLLPVHRPWLKYLLPLLSIAALFAVLTLLHKALAGYHLHDVFRQLRALPATTRWYAVLLAIASYVVLTGYDLLALRYVQQPLHVLRGMMASFVAFAVGHNIGFATLSGAAIRLRLYGSVGVSATQVALISVFCTFTTVLGAMALIAYALLAQPREAGVLLHLSPFWLRMLAWLILASLLVYGAWVTRPGRMITWRQWSLPLPNVGLTVAQILVAAVDLALAAACLYVLLPATAMVTFQAFLSIYVLGVVAIMVANVPGGLGVLESVIILALPQVPIDQLLAALLAYRVIYYFIPLVVAALLLAAHEAWLHRHRVLAVADVARDWLSAVAPQVMGAAVLLAGSVLLLSGATPAIGSRLRALNDLLPLPILELSHLLGSATGLALAILSHSLFRRVRQAWQLSMGLLLAGAVFSLLKGWDYEEATIMVLVALFLYGTRSAFYRRAVLLEAHDSLRWLAGVAVIIAVVLWIGFLAHRHVAYSHELWWSFAQSNEASRMLRAALLISLLFAGVLLHHLLMPGTPMAAAENVELQAAVRDIVAHAPHATANLALLADKRVLLHPQQDAFVMYQVSGRSWVAMGDPVVAYRSDAQQASKAASERAYELAWSYRELCDEHDGYPVFYQVTPQFLPLYVDLGLALLKLGEEARVHLPQFTLEGSQRAEFRTARRKAEREGASFEVLLPPIDAATLQQLGVISSAWLSAKSAHEKRFSVGYFLPAYLAQFPIAVVRVNDQLVAFANLWPTINRYELSVDLMRYGEQAPRGVMDYLFVEVILWGKAQGYEWFNLGMAPLSGLEQHPLAPTWHRMGNFVFDVGGHFYNFEGLRRYKEKFLPVWEPRYLAAPGGLALPRVLLDVTGLIAGGLRKIVTK